MYINYYYYKIGIFTFKNVTYYTSFCCCHITNHWSERGEGKNHCCLCGTLVALLLDEIQSHTKLRHDKRKTLACRELWQHYSFLMRTLTQKWSIGTAFGASKNHKKKKRNKKLFLISNDEHTTLLDEIRSNTILKHSTLIQRNRLRRKIKAERSRHAILLRLAKHRVRTQFVVC